LLDVDRRRVRVGVAVVEAQERDAAADLGVGAGEQGERAGADALRIVGGGLAGVALGAEGDVETLGEDGGAIDHVAGDGDLLGDAGPDLGEQDAELLEIVGCRCGRCRCGSQRRGRRRSGRAARRW
jgi:hypothetical protein